MRIASGLGDADCRSFALVMRTQIDEMSGDLVSAQKHGEEGLQEARRAGAVWPLRRALMLLAGVHDRCGHWAAAMAMEEEASVLCRVSGLWRLRAEHQPSSSQVQTHPAVEESQCERASRHLRCVRRSVRCQVTQTVGPSMSGVRLLQARTVDGSDEAACNAPPPGPDSRSRGTGPRAAAQRLATSRPSIASMANMVDALCSLAMAVVAHCLSVGVVIASMLRRAVAFADFKCPMSGSTACRRFNQPRSCLLRPSPNSEFVST